MAFKGDAKDATDEWTRAGVLLINLGTPDEPTPEALRRYLAEFLWDPRIVEIPRPIWWLILNGVILRTRPKKSARAYKSIWSENGSPLLYYARRQARLIQKHLSACGKDITVTLGMRYGNPSIAEALKHLKQAKVGRIIILPLYPQYSCSTTASSLDAVFQELMAWRRMPEVLSINHYFDRPGYLQSLANSIQEHWTQNGNSDHLLFSFHGTPRQFYEKGDPYFQQCRATAAKVAALLGLAESSWTTSFQSRFGKAEWLKPYTNKILESFPKKGIKRVDVVCPGFSADCLETIEEIQEENREYFLKAGGQEFHYIAALNDRDDHIQFLTELITQELT